MYTLVTFVPEDTAEHLRVFFAFKDDEHTTPKTRLPMSAPKTLEITGKKKKPSSGPFQMQQQQDRQPLWTPMRVTPGSDSDAESVK